MHLSLTFLKHLFLSFSILFGEVLSAYSISDYVLSEAWREPDLALKNMQQVFQTVDQTSLALL